MTLRLIIIGALLALSLDICHSQNSEGAILYQVKTNLPRTIPKEHEGMKKMLPEFRIPKSEVVFNSTESFIWTHYREEPELEGGNRGAMSIGMGVQQAEIYLNSAIHMYFL